MFVTMGASPSPSSPAHQMGRPYRLLTSESLGMFAELRETARRPSLRIGGTKDTLFFPPPLPVFFSPTPTPVPSLAAPILGSLSSPSALPVELVLLSSTLEGGAVVNEVSDEGVSLECGEE